MSYDKVMQYLMLHRYYSGKFIKYLFEMKKKI